MRPATMLGLGLANLAGTLLWGGWWLAERRRPTADRGFQRERAFLALACLAVALYALGRWVALR
jgi:hypothetical protein